MKNKLLFLVFLLGIAHSNLAQTRFFNYYDTLELYDFSDIIVNDTGFIALATYNLSTVFLNDTGKVIEINNYADSGFFHTFYHNNLNPADEDNYIVASYFHNYVTSGVQLSKFNSQFDTLWTQKYLVDTLHDHRLEDCVWASNGKIYATGTGASGLSGNPYPTDFDVILIKTDSVGNLEWMKNYPHPYKDLGFKILETSDSCLLIAGIRRYMYNQLDFADWYLLKTDFDGNVIWQRTFGRSTYPDILSDVIETSDSSYLLVGGYGDSIMFFDFTNHPYMIKVSHQGDLLWEKGFKKQGISDGYLLVHEADNDLSYIVALEANIYYGKRIWLYKMKNDTNIIWKRPLWKEGIGGNGKAYYYPYRFSELSDGFVICGKVHYPGLPRPFLIKTDKHGCDGLYSCADTSLSVYLETWEDSVCMGDSALVSVAIVNGNGPFSGVINQTQPIAETLYIMPDSSSYMFYAHPTTSNPMVEVTITNPYGNTYTAYAYFNVVDCTLGLEEESPQVSFRLSPNPASESVRLEIFQSRHANCRLELYNQQGKLITSYENATHQQQIDISHLEGGVYYFKLIGNRAMAVEKFVKL